MATAEEAPEEDEDETEDPERGAGGARRGGSSLGGGGGLVAAPGLALGGALTRRAVTLRVLLKDALLEPGEGVLSIYYLVRGDSGAQRGAVASPRWVCGPPLFKTSFEVPRMESDHAPRLPLGILGGAPP